MKMFGKMPNYELAMRLENSRKVVRSLAEMGGVSNFSEIEKNSGVKGSVLAHHLNRLQHLNVIEKEVRGTYRLAYKTPLCYIFERRQQIPIAYFGLLGKKEGRTRPETEIALELLKEEGIEPKFIFVTTSTDALNEWKGLRLPYQWIICYEGEIIDIDAIKSKVMPQLENLLRDCVVIIDCTSATKPATIAYYELARSYCAPLIYVNEETKQLKWLISKENLKEKISVL